jgi:hypothetical protein
MVHAACWAHARRQFFEAVQLNPRDPVATPIVERMDELFAVDADARRKALSVAARQVRRHESAKPLLDDIRGKIAAAQSIALPSSALSKACQYALRLWRKLIQFLEYPELELSNNRGRLHVVILADEIHGRFACVSHQKSRGLSPNPIGQYVDTRPQVAEYFVRFLSAFEPE